ncbi:MAG TPA: hypothetical protein PK563_14605 [Tenuifilaceae bacterium]|nr:hypothetical protein [Tenuifilaceae bacterium]
MGKISAKTERATIDGTEYAAGIAGGSNYKLLISKVKDYVLTFFKNKSTIDRIAVYEGTFQNSDLVSGVYSLNHELNAAFIQSVNIKTPSGVHYQNSITVTETDADNTDFDFGGAIETGVWSINLTAIKA